MLREAFVESIFVPPGRKVWVDASDNGAAEWAVIFLDAELYIQRVEAPAVVRELRQTESIPPVHCVYVSNESAAARHADYTCNPEYSRFIVEDVLDWLFRTRPHVARGKIVIAGLSLSGLAAAFLAVQFPDRFRAALCQSPSFWWNDERFRHTVPDAARPKPSFWICVGDKETDCGVSHPPSGLFQGTAQIDACRRTWEALQAHGYEVCPRIYSGGHDPTCWHEDLGLALPAVLKARTATRNGTNGK